MIRPFLILSQIKREELINDVLFILERDYDELERQVKNYRKAVIEKSYSKERLENWLYRIHQAQERYEFFRELCARAVSHDSYMVLDALEQAQTQKKENGNPDKYGFTIQFNGCEYPQIIIH